MAWTEERKAFAKRLWSDGYTASQIADELKGGVSRNAVIGLLYRMGLQRGDRKRTRKPGGDHGAARAERIQRIARRAPSKISLEPEEIPPPSVDDLAIPPAQRRTFKQLRKRHCRWPVGNPGTPEFFFCGAERAGEKPYCEAHCRVAYRKPQKAKRDDNPKLSAIIDA